MVLGLLPGYLERADSSLVHMVEDLREAGWALPGESAGDGFYLRDEAGLFAAMDAALEQGRKPVVIGVTWALVDAAAAWSSSGRDPLSDAVAIVETGGMKGRRKEWVREQVHAHLMAGFGCSAIQGEYGMTELLSQAWSPGAGQYETPPWMKVRLRRTDDPFTEERTGPPAVWTLWIWPTSEVVVSSRHRIWRGLFRAHQAAVSRFSDGSTMPRSGGAI